MAYAVFAAVIFAFHLFRAVMRGVPRSAGAADQILAFSFIAAADWAEIIDVHNEDVFEALLEHFTASESV